ncbi:MAG TPA: L,D-transpeptidase family protein [Solirubrobacteraceae bacterium]
MTRVRLLAAGLLALALAPATAMAQQPTPPPTTPAAAPIQGSLTLTAERVGSGKSVLAGSRFRVRGVLQPYVAGQTATVRFYRGKSKLKVKRVALLPSSTGKSAYFVTGFSTKNPGRITVRASHLATPQLNTAVAKPVTVDVLPLRAGPGSRGAVVRELQRRLSALGYVVGKRGVYDGRTARAVHAFRKMTGLSRTYVASKDVFQKLARGAGRFKVRYPSHGRHIEGDLTHQVLALIGKGGKVERLYPMSSGAPGTPTILGSYRVYSKTPGYNAKGMYFSAYFIRGYAVHGYASVPPYPASHGCLRVPIPDAVSIYRWIGYGTRVDTYYR